MGPFPSVVQALSLVLCLAVLWAAPGAAQSSRASARALFDAGVSAYDRGELDAALTAFTRAYELAPHPAVRVNMANCLEQLGRYAAALDHYQRFLHESGDLLPAARRVEVETAIQRLRSRVGKVGIVVEPASATLTIDDTVAPRSQVTVQLSVGLHRLRAEASGYVSAERSVEVRGGDTQSIALELLPARPTLASAPDGWSETTAPTSAVARSHGRASARSAGARSPRRTLMWSAVAGTGALALGFLASSTLNLVAQRDFDAALSAHRDAQLDSAAREQARQNGLEAAQRAKASALASDVFLGATLAAGSSALVLFLLDRGEERVPSASLRVTPSVHARAGAGVRVRGEF